MVEVSNSSEIALLSSERVTRQEQVKEELRCRICMGIIWEPKECKVCETCFCGGCLQKWLRSSNGKCPMKCSEEPKFRDRPHKIIRNMLDELVFKCKHETSGCQIQIEYARVLDHEANCEFAFVRCPGFEDGCTVSIKKCDLQLHVSTCPLVPVNCEYCGKRVRKSALRAHYMSCEEAELECEMCRGVFKKKNYPIHVSALCEEGVMSCGRCSGTYKRKYKEYHDCVRHLQNCQKTMNEEIAVLKEKIAEKDRKYSDLEQRMMTELDQIRKMFESMKEQQTNDSPQIQKTIIQKPESVTKIKSNYSSPLGLSYESVTWDLNLASSFNQINQFTATLDAKSASNLGFIQSTPLTSHSPSHLTIDLEFTMTALGTAFIPIYYILGLLPHETLQTPLIQDSFEGLFTQLSPTCVFLPFSAKSYHERMRFSLKRRRLLSVVPLQESQELPLRAIQSEESKMQAPVAENTHTRYEIEDIDKGMKIKVIEEAAKSGYRLVVGVYCSQGLKNSNHKEFKVKIVNA